MKQRATVVCRLDRRILLVSREGTRWSLPGGKPEAGEDLRETARRELMEETCLRAIDLHYLFGFTGTRTCHHVFAAQINDGEHPVPSNEITRCTWVDIADVANLAVSASTKGIAEILAVVPIALPGSSDTGARSATASVSPLPAFPNPLFRR